MLDLLSDPNAWAALLSLTALEIVLGIDNVIFLSIVSGKLPPEQQKAARRTGLALALLMRIGLLMLITWLQKLEAPFLYLGWSGVSLGDGTEAQAAQMAAAHMFGLSWRDLILIGGGFFLLYKGTTEIHHMMEGGDEAVHVSAKRAVFSAVILQIVVLDVVFSLDSVLTAVAMAPGMIEVMILAVVISMAVMLAASEPVAAFVNRHPTVKMLALSFLILVGATLVADGVHYHIERGFIYAAIAFSVGVETLNLVAAARRKRAAEGKDGEGV
ncbi:MAG: TerC family protein [Alphaproteobacteria bacterium]